MDALLANERITEDTVYDLLQRPEEPIRSLIAAYDAYRSACQAVVFADFTLAETKEARMWNAHVEGKKYFSTQLRRLRKQNGSNAPTTVQTRALADLYKKWIRGSIRFYNDHIYKLSTAFGIPELEDIAQQIKPSAQLESLQANILTPELQLRVVNSCHQTLIYLGDLSRWRASEKLDKNPDFGPALGYYGLACTIRPASGMGQHQSAVVALEQRHHLQAIYHLYRSICVAEPHPNGSKNLKMQFEKTNAAWDKGELIQKGPPNDPEAPKRALIGWFVRLHSMCFKGEQFRGFDELEREVMGQLSAELKLRSLGSALSRMVMVNIASQHTSIENYKEQQTPENERAFYSFLRINLRTYTTLLEILQDDLIQVTRATADMGDVELANKILVASARVLPALRVYSCWLYQNYQLLLGLKTDPSLASPIESFWKAYGKTLDLVASNFSIWELETYSPVPYMLEEDVNTLGFEPLVDRSGGKANKVWNMPDGLAKPRFNDRSVTRLSPADEMLCRVYGFLEDGLYFAHELDESPIKIKGDRVFYGDGDEIEQLFMPASIKKPAKKAPAKPKPAPTNVPLSYARAAANGKAQASKPVAAPPSRAPAFTQSQSQGTQDAQLSRMVDDLVDDDEAKDPLTPPQQFSTNPTVVQANGDSAIEASPEIPPKTNATGYQQQQQSRSSNKYASVSSLWPTSPVVPATASPRISHGLPHANLTSPPNDRGHSRVGSVNSIRSRGSQNIADSWSSLEGLPQGTGMAQASAGSVAPLPGLGGAYGDGQLLFGAGGGMWSSAPGGRKSFGGISQDGGYGG